MKKLFLITFILTCFSCLGQNNPDRFPDGIGTKLIDPLGNTTAEINAFTNNALGRLAFNTDEGKWKRWDGSAWVDAFSGGGAIAGITQTGTIGIGDYLLDMGDQSAKVIIDEASGTVFLGNNLANISTTATGVSIEGDIDIEDTLNVLNELYVTSDSYLSGNLSVTGDLEVPRITSDLTVTGAFTATGDIDANAIFVNDPASISTGIPNLGQVQSLIAANSSTGHTIQNNGTNLPAQPNLNFSDDFIVDDNAGNTSTDVSIDGSKVLTVHDQSYIIPTYWGGTTAQHDAIFGAGFNHPEGSLVYKSDAPVTYVCSSRYYRL